MALLIPFLGMLSYTTNAIDQTICVCHDGRGKHEITQGVLDLHNPGQIALEHCSWIASQADT